VSGSRKRRKALTNAVPPGSKLPSKLETKQELQGRKERAAVKYL
jgi:hypothetical protein